MAEVVAAAGSIPLWTAESGGPVRGYGAALGTASRRGVGTR